jgi:hypothetical protein
MKTFTKTFFLSILFLLSIFPTSAALYDFEADGLCYKILSEEDKTAEVVWKSNSSANNYPDLEYAVIPEHVIFSGKTYNVTQIALSTFMYAPKLKSVTIPKSINYIGISAFAPCYNLTEINVDENNNYYTSVDNILYTKDMTKLVCCPGGRINSPYIPNGVTTIDGYAFFCCSSLQDITLPESTVTIGVNAFYGCNTLGSIIIPKAVQSIGSTAFGSCDNLTAIIVNEDNKYFASSDGILYSKDLKTLMLCPAGKANSITIPNFVTTINHGAFQGCKRIASVTLPSSVKHIDSPIFMACWKLSEIIVDNENPNYTSVDGVLYTKDISSLIQCPQGRSKDIDIPNTVISINQSAFSGCSLNTITIPESVKNIYKGGLACRSLQSIKMLSSIPPTSNDIFAGYGSNMYYSETKLYVPKGSLAAYQAAEPWKNFQNIEEMDLSAEPGGPSDHYDFKYNGLYYNILSEEDKTVEVTYQDLTYNYSNIENTEIPEKVFYSNNIYTVTAIGECAFQYCHSLKHIILPNSIISIGENSFWDSALESITIPNSVETIGANAFSFTELKTITIPESITNIGKLGFLHCSLLTEINVNNNNKNYTSIDGVLYSNDASRLICCPGGITKPVIIPASVTTIEDYAFGGCKMLQDITVDDNNTIFISYEGAVYLKDKSKLICAPCGKDEIKILESITTIGAGAFYESTLTKVTIPDLVKNIEDFAFSYCYNLENITFGSSVSNLGYWSFVDCRNLKNIYCKSTTPSSGSPLFSQQNYKEVTVHVPMGCLPTYKNPAPSNIWKNFQNVEEMDFSAEPGGPSDCFDFKSNGICYNILSEEDKTVEVTRSSLYSNKNYPDLEYAVIPEHVTFSGKIYNITNIGRDALYGSPKLKSVTISKSINLIGSGVFSDCPNLTKINVDENNNSYVSVDNVLYTKDMKLLINCPGGRIEGLNIPNGVTTIGWEAFAGCSALENIILPESLVTIGLSAFANCKISSIIIPQNVQNIDYSIFSSCDDLTDITVSEDNKYFASADGILYSKDLKTLIIYPAGKDNSIIAIPDFVSRINQHAFYTCDKITSVTIPSSIEHIESPISSACWNFDEIIVDEDNPNYASVDGVLYTKDMSTLLRCPEGRNKDLDIPNTVVSTNGYAFYVCYLNSITFPESVKYIDALNCNSLQSIKMRPSTPPNSNYISNFLYYGTKLYVPKGSLAEYQAAEPWKNFQNIEEMDFSGIEEVNADDDVDVRVENGSIIIEGADGNQLIEVYDIAGKMVYGSYNNSISGLSKGLYILRIANKTYKLKL